MKNAIVIFDVDGVLLQLTQPEEELFFTALADFVPTQALSRDWNSYRIRNDDDIISEILEQNGKSPALKSAVVANYIRRLERALSTGALSSHCIAGAERLLRNLAPVASLGIATANLREAARLRLLSHNLWALVETHAVGADGGGHKHEILARLLKTIDLPKSRIVYIGDNLTDVIAGRENGVQFIGFSTDKLRREQLADHGVTRLSADHGTTLDFIRQILGV